MRVVGDRYRWEFRLFPGERCRGADPAPVGHRAHRALVRRSAGRAPGSAARGRVHVPGPRGRPLAGRAGVPARGRGASDAAVRRARPGRRAARRPQPGVEAGRRAAGPCGRPAARQLPGRAGAAGRGDDPDRGPRRPGDDRRQRCRRGPAAPDRRRAAPAAGRRTPSAGRRRPPVTRPAPWSTAAGTAGTSRARVARSRSSGPPAPRCGWTTSSVPVLRCSATARCPPICATERTRSAPARYDWASRVRAASTTRTPPSRRTPRWPAGCAGAGPTRFCCGRTGWSCPAAADRVVEVGQHRAFPGRIWGNRPM